MQTFCILLLLLAVGASQFDPWSDLERTIGDRMKALKKGAMDELQKKTKSLNDELKKQLETVKNRNYGNKNKIIECMSQNHTESLRALAKVNEKTTTCLNEAKQNANDKLTPLKIIVGQSSGNDDEGSAARKEIEEAFKKATQDCFMEGQTNFRELGETHTYSLRLCAL